MSKFVKKPVVVEATQWFKNGDHPMDYSKNHEGLEGGVPRIFTASERKQNEWEGDVVRYYRRPDDSGDRKCEHCGRVMNDHGWIDTLEGGHNVCPGDWIITGIKGENYPCKPDIFQATYEPVVDGIPCSPASMNENKLRTALSDFVGANTPEEWNKMLIVVRAMPDAGGTRNIAIKALKTLLELYLK